jgi:hypothetical protein
MGGRFRKIMINRGPDIAKLLNDFAKNCYKGKKHISHLYAEKHQ